MKKGTLETSEIMQVFSNTSYPLGPIASGKLLLPVTSTNTAFHNDIILIMRDDKIKSVVLSNCSIMTFGLEMYNGQVHQNLKRTYISQRMRELGRLLITARKHQIQKLEDCLESTN